ncbi:MAG: ComF family protein [Chloroflexi bacterium]|nr:ComF family protein [Chloroflexota bacterium]
MSLLDLLMPPACAACGRVGALLCPRCLNGLQVPSRPADRFLAPDGGVVVGDALCLAMAAFAYEGPMRRALAAMKYGGASRLAPILARAATPALDNLLRITGPAVLVPVPLHRERQRARGYNQAELIARQLGTPMALALERVRPTTKQHRLNRTARLANLRAAFRVSGAVPLTAILVDDIITTTATLEACASVLRQAGCSAVYGFSLAREV